MSLLKDKRIFIVEDDITNMAVYAVALKHAGAIVIQDYWHTGTIRMLIQHLPIDIIVLDLMLRNGVSGYDIFDKVVEHQELASIPVVAVSAADPETEIPKTKAKGFTGFIGKPISLQMFPNQIAACIEGEHLWSASREDTDIWKG